MWYFVGILWWKVVNCDWKRYVVFGVKWCMFWVIECCLVFDLWIGVCFCVGKIGGWFMVVGWWNGWLLFVLLIVNWIG